MYRKRKGMEIVGLGWLVLIGGIIFGMVVLLTYFSSFGVIQWTLGIRGGIGLTIEIEEAGTKAVALLPAAIEDRTVMETLGRSTISRAETEKEIAALEKLIADGTASGYHGITIKQGAITRTAGKPETGETTVEFSVPLPGGWVVTAEAS